MPHPQAPARRRRPVAGVRTVGRLAVLALLVACSGGGEGAEDRGAERGSPSSVDGGSERTGSGPASSPPVTAAPRRAFVAAREYAFAVTGPLVEGSGVLELRNDGTELHMVVFNRLREGQSAAQLAAVLQGQGPSSIQETVEPESIGAPGGALGPGHRLAVTAPALKAGRYALVCLYPAADRTTHAAKGMVAELEVVAPDAGSAPSSRPVDHRLVVADGRFEGAPTSLRPGATAFELRNAGGVHNLIAVRLEEGRSYLDVEAYFRKVLEGKAAEAGPPPGELVGLVFEIAADQNIIATFDLEPGRYFLGCAYADQDPASLDDDHHRTAEHVELVVS